MAIYKDAVSVESPLWLQDESVQRQLLMGISDFESSGQSNEQASRRLGAYESSSYQQGAGAAVWQEQFIAMGFAQYSAHITNSRTVFVLYLFTYQTWPWHRYLPRP